MIIEFASPVSDKPITIPATQFVVRDHDGSPIAVGAEYGPEGAQDVSVRRLPDFKRTLRVLGITSTIVIDQTYATYAGPMLEIVSRIGMPATIVPVTKFVVYQDNGTPIVAGNDLGSNRTPTVTMVGLPDFQKTLRTLGIRTTVFVETLQIAKPQPGARLLAGPKE